MFVEANILCRNKCLHESWRQFVVVGKDTIGTTVTPRSQLFPIGREDLSGELVDGVLQLLDVGHIADGSCENAEENDADSQDSQDVERPKDAKKLLPHQKYSFKTTKVRHLIEN